MAKFYCSFANFGKHFAKKNCIQILLKCLTLEIFCDTFVAFKLTNIDLALLYFVEMFVGIIQKDLIKYDFMY
jgi:hypothetical protein